MKKLHEKFFTHVCHYLFRGSAWQLQSIKDSCMFHVLADTRCIMCTELNGTVTQVDEKVKQTRLLHCTSMS